jgi:hypothetical protein
MVTMKAAEKKPLSPKAQLEAYLSRMRRTLPFPCTTEECCFGLMPEFIAGWRKEDGLVQIGRKTNLALSMTRTYDGQIIHVCTEDSSEYIAARLGHRGYEKVFWVRAPRGIPVPVDHKRLPFILPDDHPHGAAIRKWVDEAMLIETEIEKSLLAIDRYFGIVKTPTQIKNTWPELMNLIHFKGNTVGALSNQLSQQIRAKINAAVSPAEREHISTQLARALMLPEQRADLQAWAKFYTQESQQ